MRRRRLLLAGIICSTLSCGGQVDDPYARHLRDGAAETSQGNFSAAMADIQAALALRPKDAIVAYAAIAQHDVGLDLAQLQHGGAQLRRATSASS